MGERTFFGHRQSGPTFRFKEGFDLLRYFWFPRDLVKNRLWGTWPTAAQAVFPVILYFMDKKGSCFPGLDTIGVLAGRDRKTVSQGVDFLLSQHIPLERSTRITAAGRKAYTYRWPVVTRQRGLFFPFRHCVFDGGNWAMLTPTAQALYVVMRAFGLISGDGEIDIVFSEDLSGDAPDYGKRDFEFCRADLDVLGELSGIRSRRTLNAALDSLCVNWLVARDAGMDYEDGALTWRVFLTPPRYFKRDYLNAAIDKKFPLSKKLSKRLSKRLAKGFTETRFQQGSNFP